MLQSRGLGLLCLAKTDSLRRLNIVASHGDLRLSIQPMASSVLAGSLDAFQDAGELLLSPSWRFGPCPRPEPGLAKAGVFRRSLEAFLVGACIRWERELPPLPQAEFRMIHWPDLGDWDPGHLKVLKIAAAMLGQQRFRIEALADALAMPRRRIMAVTWAFWASGLLEAEHPPETPSSGFGSRLAHLMDLMGAAVQRVRERVPG